MMKGWRSYMAILPRPTPTRGVSEIRPALRFKSNDSLLRYFKDTSTLYLEIVDYPGEWLLDLPMLAQDYLSWSRQMTGLTQWSARRMVGEMANDVRRAGPASACRRKTGWQTLPPLRTEYLHHCKQQGCTLFSGRFVLPGDMAEHPRCNSSRGRMSMQGESNWRRPISIPMPECCARR